MAKTDAASKVDVIACAERCEAKALECVDAFPSIGLQLTEAATMLRSLHRTLVQVDCQHLLTFSVTRQMIDSGRETREPGKYCMTCGERLDKPAVEPPPPETAP